MKYSTLKELYYMSCNNKEYLRSNINSHTALKSLNRDVKSDIKMIIQDIRDGSILGDMELLSSLLSIKNDIAIRYNTIK